MQPVPVITKVVNSHPAYGEVYLIQQYVIKSVSDLRQIGGFLWVLRFPFRSIWNTVKKSQKWCVVSLIVISVYFRWRSHKPFQPDNICVPLPSDNLESDHMILLSFNSI
jgi:hypothetical protein